MAPIMSTEPSYQPIQSQIKLGIDGIKPWLICDQVHMQKILPRYENMVFFTVARSFFYWCTIILKILLFVVCAVVFLLRVICVYGLWIFHNLWKIRTILNRTVPYSDGVQFYLLYGTYSLHTFVHRLSFKDMKKREI